MYVGSNTISMTCARILGHPGLGFLSVSVVIRHCILHIYIATGGMVKVEIDIFDSHNRFKKLK